MRWLVIETHAECETMGWRSQCSMTVVEADDADEAKSKAWSDLTVPPRPEDLDVFPLNALPAGWLYTSYDRYSHPEVKPMDPIAWPWGNEECSCRQCKNFYDCPTARRLNLAIIDDEIRAAMDDGKDDDGVDDR